MSDKSTATDIETSATELLANDTTCHPLMNTITGEQSFTISKISKATFKPSFLTIFREDGNPGIVITREMANGKIDISDDMIAELIQQNTNISQAVQMLQELTGSSDSCENTDKRQVFNQTLNTLLNAFVNQLHIYMADKLSPGFRD